MPLLQQFMDILRSGSAESGQSQEAAEVAAQRTRRAVGPSPMNPTPQPIPEHLQSFKNYGKASVDSLVTTFQDIVRNPESIVGTGELGMAIPRANSMFVPLKKLLGFREQGMTSEQMAKELGMNPRTLDKKIKEYVDMGALEPMSPGPQAGKLNVGEFKRLQEQGLKLPEIAKQLGVSPRTLSRQREAAGLQIDTSVGRPREGERHPHGFWSEGGEGYTAIRKALKENRPLADVARDFGVSPAAVTIFAKKAGITDIPKRGFPKRDVSDIEQLMDKGLTWKQIGARLGMTASNAWQLAARNGLIDVEAIMDRKFNPGVKRQRKPGE